ncbi:hypothetical protein ACGFIG_09465 [Micromonospora sp. NPDC049048]|uniref:hypothetical protein n=1 Tax=Micromonospora sp. NPDC049048 TaxID=3364263 RepID=UPI00371303CB
MTTDTTVTITTGRLAQALGSVVPFASRDVTLPSVCAVQLHCAEGVLTASATNRYVIGHARQPATGAFTRPRLLHWRDARALRKALSRFMRDQGSSADLVAITEADASLTVKFGYVTLSLDEPEGAKGAPDLGPILAKLPTNDTAGVQAPIGISRRVVKPVLKAARWAPCDPMRWLMAEPGKPFRVDIGDWFVAAVMPVSLRGDEKNVPIELPQAAEAVTA